MTTIQRHPSTHLIPLLASAVMVASSVSPRTGEAKTLLAESVAGTGITVNGVVPGPTRSRGVGDFVETLANATGESFAQFESVQRLG